MLALAAGSAAKKKDEFGKKPLQFATANLAPAAVVAALLRHGGDAAETQPGPAANEKPKVKQKPGKSPGKGNKRATVRGMLAELSGKR
eukprot:7379687-Prymnesium_polylepis.3